MKYETRNRNCSVSFGCANTLSRMDLGISRPAHLIFLNQRNMFWRKNGHPTVLENAKPSDYGGKGQDHHQMPDLWVHSLYKKI